MAKRLRMRPNMGTQTEAEFSIRAQLVAAQRELADVRWQLIEANRTIANLKNEAPRASDALPPAAAGDKEPCLKARIVMLEGLSRALAEANDIHVANIKKLADRLRQVIYATGVDVETS